MKLKQKVLLKYISARLNILALISKEKAAEEAIQFFSTPKFKKKKHTPPVFEQGTRHVLDYKGKKIKGYQWNPEAEKKVLVLHGFESNSRNFYRYFEELIQQNIQVIAFDAPAHGKSEGKTITLPEYIEVIELLKQNFGPFHGYIAHSFGGLAVVHFLEANPHQPTDKLALIAPATETLTSIDLYFKMLNLSEDIRPAFNKIIQERTGRQAEHFSINRAVDNIQAKIKWYHDKKDFITPISDVKKVIEKKLPNIQFSISNGLGHNRIYREEEIIKDVIGFLAAE